MNLLEKIKWTTIRDNVLKPLLEKVGTATSSLLLLPGIPLQETLLDQVATGLIAFGLILFDIIVGVMNRKAAEREAAEKALRFADVRQRYDNGVPLSGSEL